MVFCCRFCGVCSEESRLVQMRVRMVVAGGETSRDTGLKLYNVQKSEILRLVVVETDRDERWKLCAGY